MRAIGAFRASVTGRTISGIVSDLTVTIALLAGLLLIQGLVDLASPSPSFEERFTKLHENVVLMNYLVVALKGVVRVFLLPWKDRVAGGG